MSIFLEQVNIQTYRGITNYYVDEFGYWTSVTGSNSSTKSSFLYALSFLGSDRMHDLSDIPASIRTNKINPFDVPIKISYLFELKNGFEKLISDGRIVEILIELYNGQIEDIKNRKIDDHVHEYLTNSLNELKSRKPLAVLFNDALYETIKNEILEYSSLPKYKSLFHSKGVQKDSKEILKECKYIKINLELSLSDGPHSNFCLLDENKNIVVNDEVFYHWLTKIKSISDDITFTYVLGATFIKSVLSNLKLKNHNIKRLVTLSFDGSNIEYYIQYLLLHRSKKLCQINDYFKIIFNQSIRFRKVLPEDCIETESSIVVDIDESNRWFAIDNLSDGMMHVLRILLQLVSCNKGDILIIDEPELHLHPGAARLLSKILYEKKLDIQIICATHMPLFLNPKIVDKVILNQRNSDGSYTKSVVESNNLELALSEIGSSGLDILLYDIIIWIEGPSDEIYINKWLNLLSENLKKINISDIGFIRYGGSLYEHIEPEKIKMINRKSIFIIDSDKKSSKQSIKTKKKRFIEKCKENDIYCWLTKKKEIENYIPNRLLENIFGLPPNSLKISEFDDVFDKLKGIINKDKKVRLANLTTPKMTVDDIKNDSLLYQELMDLIDRINSF